MSEPLLPHPDQPADDAGAEPGHGAPNPGPDAEPDVFEDDGERNGDAAQDLGAAGTRHAPAFRTPEPGSGLSPEELAAESGD